MAMVEQEEELLDPRPIAGLFAAFTCLLGAGVSTVLTVVKYRSQFACDATLFTGCPSGGTVNCERVFSSEWATFFDLPVTIFATAFYIVGIAVGCGIALRKKPFYGAERPILLILGWIGLVISVVMAAYAHFVVHAVCLYCMSLYLVSIILYGCALWASRTSVRRGLRHVMRARWILTPGGIRGVLVALSIFALSFVPQAWAYGAATCGIAGSCPAKIRTLPKTTVVLGSSYPKWLFAEFVDPACHFCSVQRNKLHKLLVRHSDKLQLQVFLYPRDPACAPRGFEVVSQSSAQRGSCVAALATVCADFQQLGMGYEMLGRFYEMGDETFTRGAAKSFAVKMNLNADELSLCMRSDEARDFLGKQLLFGQRQRLKSTPRLYAIPVDDKGPRFRDALVFDGDKHISMFERLLSGNETCQGAR